MWFLWLTLPKRYLNAEDNNPINMTFTFKVQLLEEQFCYLCVLTFIVPKLVLNGKDKGIAFFNYEKLNMKHKTHTTHKSTPTNLSTRKF